MRATGIVRRIDELGRVGIPKEIRRTLRIQESPVADDMGSEGAWVDGDDGFGGEAGVVSVQRQKKK